MSRVVSLGSRFEPESRQVDSPKPRLWVPSFRCLTAFEGFWFWLYGIVCGCFVAVAALSLVGFMAFQGFTAARTAEFKNHKTLR